VDVKLALAGALRLLRWAERDFTRPDGVVAIGEQQVVDLDQVTTNYHEASPATTCRTASR
jgi:hypothetical protein